MSTLPDALTEASCYPHPTYGRVERIETHASWVFLAGAFVYKVKRPVDHGFLDYSTLERRREMCEREVELNRRLAPSVYLGVVPITRSEAGLSVEGGGEAVEWAVKMHRLPESGTLRHRLPTVEPVELEAVGRLLAGFHASAERGEHVRAAASFERVSTNVHDNLVAADQQVGETIHGDVLRRLHEATDTALAECRALIESRAARDLPCDTHGDIRLEHVYRLPWLDEPLVIMDCIEFNDDFRYADPVADVAFLAMDLAFYGRPDLATALTDSWSVAADDAEGLVLMPLYTSYRSAVRAKVHAITAGLAQGPNVRVERRKAAGHWLFALAALVAPAERPALLLVGGLPGTGKSTVARGLVEHAGFEMIRTDVVRKELAGLPEFASAAAGFDSGIYSPAGKKRVYDECLRRASDIVFAGGRVVVDAGFWSEALRRRFLDRSLELGVTGLFLECHAPPAVVKQRIEQRDHDASDADWHVHLRARDLYEAPGAATRRVTVPIDCEPAPRAVVEGALEALGGLGLL